MSQPAELPNNEELIRALPHTKWDPVSGRVSPDAFIDKDGVSVSRPAILSTKEITSIFFSDLHKPPERVLLGMIAVSAGAVRDACTSKAEFNVRVSIVADPVVNDRNATNNIAHALIVGMDEGGKRKLTKGQASAIIRNAKQPVRLIDPDASSSLNEKRGSDL